MAPAKLADRIRDYVRHHYVDPARHRGHSHVRVRAGEVHRRMQLDNLLPSVCSALATKRFQTANGLVLEKREGATSGAAVTFVYALTQPRQPSRAPAPRRRGFLDFRGVGKELFASLGGGEAFIRAEREAWEDPPQS